MKAYADLANLPEDERINVIGKTVETGLRVGFVVEDDAKADRYIEKLLALFPTIEVVSRGPGPNNTILIAMDLKTN